MRKKHEPAIIAGTAILALAFLFVMTATKGEYWGSSEMDEYIIKITEGEEQSYLNSETPTAMVINKVSGSSAFLRRDCEKRGTCYAPESCTVVDQGYVISGGRKIAKASVVKCTESESSIDRTAPTAQAYTTQNGVY